MRCETVRFYSHCQSICGQSYGQLESLTGNCLFSTLTENKLGYRYPRGESYLDVISRLDPLVQELESYQEPVLIVGHQGVLRLIYAYFTGMDRTEACNASIPLNTVRVHFYLYLNLYFRTYGQLY